MSSRKGGVFSCRQSDAAEFLYFCGCKEVCSLQGGKKKYWYRLWLTSLMLFVSNQVSMWRGRGRTNDFSHKLFLSPGRQPQRILLGHKPYGLSILRVMGLGVRGHDAAASRTGHPPRVWPCTWTSPPERLCPARKLKGFWISVETNTTGNS